MKCYSFVVLVVFSFALLMLAGCIEEIEFEPKEPDRKLVVSGSLTTSSGPHRVRLSRTTAFNRQVVDGVSGARVQLFEDGNAVAPFREMEDGWYQIDAAQVEGKVGSAYHLEITLASGEQYVSVPDVLPQHLAVDSMRADFRVEEYLNDQGRLLEGSFVNVYVQNEVPDWQEGPFARMDLEVIYKFNEILCGPFDPPFSCYVRKNPNRQDLLLVDGSDKSRGSRMEERVWSERIDRTYNYVHSFRVFQRSISEPAFRYWSKVDQVINQVGGIFDPAPATVQGNVFNVNDPGEIVLGYFEAAAVDTSFTFVRKGFLDGLDRLIILYCDDSIWAGRNPTECCNCNVLDNSTM
ncbi:MAG: DUF4249 domain-containing protein, partial [Bacteroidota bacterium]